MLRLQVYPQQNPYKITVRASRCALLTQCFLHLLLRTLAIAGLGVGDRALRRDPPVLRCQRRLHAAKPMIGQPRSLLLLRASRLIKTARAAEHTVLHQRATSNPKPADSPSSPVFIAWQCSPSSLRSFAHCWIRIDSCCLSLRESSFPFFRQSFFLQAVKSPTIEANFRCTCGAN